MVISFETPEGALRAYLPDDVTAGERFTGSVVGPSGYAMRLGSQRVNAGDSFRAVAPVTDETPLDIVFSRRGGTDLSSVSLQLGAKGFQESSIRVPALVQAGELFAIRGPFDGDGKTTHVFMGGGELSLLAESPRKAIVRAPADVVGPAAFTVQKKGLVERGLTRSLSIALMSAADADAPASHNLHVSGLAGFDRDVPIDISTTHFYLKASEIPADGTFTLRGLPAREDAAPTAALVIPQSRREEVAVVLRTPRQNPEVSLAEQHARGLRMLAFDPIPVAADLLGNDRLGSEAASALLVLDEVSGMKAVFDSMPQSGLSVQRIGLSWFLEHQGTLGDAVDASAHDAAVRLLARIGSTANAELAIYTLGLTGSAEDFPLLARFARSTAPVDSGLRAASHASLARLGSGPHLDAIRGELEMPLPTGATYTQVLRLADALRTAALSGAAALVPAICLHLDDQVVSQIDISVDPARIAAGALSRILETTTPALLGPGQQRSPDDWKTYCTQVRVQ